jgi:hypothetical protein
MIRESERLSEGLTRAAELWPPPSPRPGYPSVKIWSLLATFLGGGAILVDVPGDTMSARAASWLGSADGFPWVGLPCEFARHGRKRTS